MNIDHKPGDQVLVRGEIRGKHTRNLTEIFSWAVMFIDEEGDSTFVDVRPIDIVATAAGPVGQEQVDYRDAEIRKLRAERDALARAAAEVMDILEEHGPSIVPHLLDTDQNAGERLRALARRALTGGEDSGGER